MLILTQNALDHDRHCETLFIGNDDHILCIEVVPVLYECEDRLYCNCRFAHRNCNGQEGAELAASVDTGSLYDVQREGRLHVLTHIEYNGRCCDCRNDQRNVAVCQTQSTYHELYETGRCNLNRDHHNCQNKRICTVADLEIVNGQTIRGQCGEEYGQNCGTACNNQGVPVAQPNVKVRGLRKFTTGNILDIGHQVTARQELQRLSTQSSVPVGCVHDHDVQRNQTDQCQQNADNEAASRFQSLHQNVIVLNTNVFHYAPRPPFLASFCCFLYSLTRALRSCFFRCSSSSRFIRNTRIPRAAVMINRITEAAPAMP